MREEIRDVKFVDYNPTFKQELNSWSDAEQAQGLSGLKDFVTTRDAKLGDYIDFFASQTDIVAKLAFDKESLAGFILYTFDMDKAHIELAGTNPNLRGRGYSQKIMLKLKQELQQQGINKISFEVNNNNKVALRAFGKIAKPSEDQFSSNNSNYTEMEL